MRVPWTAPPIAARRACATRRSQLSTTSMPRRQGLLGRTFWGVVTVEGGRQLAARLILANNVAAWQTTRDA